MPARVFHEQEEYENMIPHIDLTPEERASAAWDAYLCQNVMSKFTYLKEIGIEEADFQTLWADRQDISYG